MTHILIASLYWNPSRDIFTLPFLDRPITWYGVLFVLGFIIGYLLILPIFSRFLEQSRHLSNLDIKDWPALIQAFRSPSSAQREIFQSFSALLKKKSTMTLNEQALKTSLLEEFNRLLGQNIATRKRLEEAFPEAIQSTNQTSVFLADRLCWFVVAGTLIGARLGAVFFYDWNYYVRHPIEIIKVWNGGLASHGGALGIMLALYLYVLYVKKWTPTLSFLTVLDAISIPIALAGCFIRIGNFVNQEILGTPTQEPWGVVFGDPLGEPLDFIPRHPVQLYESFAYLTTFMVLFLLWRKKKNQLRTGALSGLLLIFIFSSRFILEFWKANQDSILSVSSFQIGQLLSLPFIILGLLFLTIPKSTIAVPTDGTSHA